MLELPNGLQPVLWSVMPAVDVHWAVGLLLFKEHDFGIRIGIDVSDERVACAKALDGLLEKNLPIGRFVGIKIDGAHGVVVGVVACDKHFAFTIKVEVGEADMAVRRETVWWCDGLVDSDGVECGIGTADDVNIVDRISTNQFLSSITKHIAG